MKTRISALELALVNIGLNASAWKNCRVYINDLGKDITAYFTFDDFTDPVSEADDNLLEGVTLKVFSNCAQGQAWRLNRAKQVKHNLMERMYATGISKTEPPAEWREVIL